MNYYTIKPPAVLADFVRYFWVLECDVPVKGDYVYRSMADGCAEILFHYEGQFDELLNNEKAEKSFLSGVHGPSAHFRRFRINKSFGIFGAYLYPYSLKLLFKTPASELSNNMPELHSYLGKDGVELEEQIMVANNNEERVEILSTFLIGKLYKIDDNHSHVTALVRSMIDDNGLVKVGELASRCCLSVRQFERKFKEYAGFSPKFFSRIIRFQSVFSEFSGKQSSLSEVAYACGYYDHSHFIQDFREFSGYNPKEFLSGKTNDKSIVNE
jgi:AraC-like DNA-binding protein